MMVTSSFSNFMRAPRPYPRRRRSNASWMSAVVISIPAGSPSIILTSPEPLDSTAVNQRIILSILPCPARERLLHVDIRPPTKLLVLGKTMCCSHAFRDCLPIYVLVVMREFLCKQFD